VDRMVVDLSEREARTFMPVEMEMFIVAIRVVTGPSGITVVGTLRRDRSSVMQSEKAC